MTPQARTQPRKRQFLIGLLLALVVAIGVRVEHDTRQRGSAADADAERRATAMPNDLQAQLDWGSILAKREQLPDAVKVFAHAAQIAPNDPRPFTWLGILAIKDHRPDYARANFLRATKLNPADPYPWHALGDLYGQSHLRRRAIDAYEHAAQLQPTDEVAWRQLGVLETESNLLARGYDALLRATKLDSGDHTAWIDLGNCALVTGHLPQAKQAFDRVLAGNPDDPTALLGDAEAAMQLDPSPAGLLRAEQLANRALALIPTPHTHLVLGRIALARKDYSQAVSDLNLAVEGNHKDLSAYGYLSQAYSGMGKPELARKASADYQREDARKRSRPQRGVTLDEGE